MDATANKKLVESLRELLCNRIKRLLKQDVDLSAHSIGELMNFLFTIEGDAHNIGGFGVTYAVMKSLVSEDGIWAKQEKNAEPETIQRELVH